MNAGGKLPKPKRDATGQMVIEMPVVARLDRTDAVIACAELLASRARTGDRIHRRTIVQRMQRNLLEHGTGHRERAVKLATYRRYGPAAGKLVSELIPEFGRG